MNFEVSSDLKKELKKIKKKNQSLSQKIEKQLLLFTVNHFHPSLRTHKLSGNDNVWSISIDRSVRMLYKLEESHAYFFDIGTHEQVYKR